tara:strand:+ start:12956 stop:14683 length:1728 start_codon:yes stop_codon:yes gene_type:complete
MINFELIRWRNFLSTGNQFTEIDLTKSRTNLIVGANGAGKSTILDALTFSLYNKPFRKITKSQLVNTTNERDCTVEIEFSINSREYKVIRGMRPTVFEIWVDDKLQNQFASAIDQQKYLEENVLKLNYKSFTQTIILGSATFVPFMQLSATNRRDIVEDILDIKIFSAMSSILKDRKRGIDESIRELTLRKEMVEDKISMQKSFIKDLDKKGKEKIEEKQQKVEELWNITEKLVDDNQKQNLIISQELNPELEKLSNASSSLKKMNTIKAKLEQRIQNITSDHKFFVDNVSCPTCTQSIEESFRVNKLGEIEAKAKELNNAYTELKSTIVVEQDRDKEFIRISEQITKLTHGISKNNTRVSEYQRQSRELEQEIQDITTQIANRNTERNALKKLQKELITTEKSKSQQTENISYLEFAHSLMRDGGVKSKLIKRYLPLMNKQINHYLQKMDFYINFTLDEEFKENIKSPIHEKFSYESFSEGEKMRIDLALLFTWRDIARMRNSSSTNLLILDEVFDSSLDATGTDFFTVIIRYLLEDVNVFVISHKQEELTDKFDNLINFEKVNGFSKAIRGTV